MENNDLVTYVRGVVDNFNAAFGIETQKQVALDWYLNTSPNMTFHDFVMICKEHELMDDAVLVMFAKAVLD